MVGSTKEIGGFVKIILFANTDWYLYNYRLSLADALKKEGHDVMLLSPAGDYSEKIKANGYFWQQFNLTRSGVNPIWETWTLFKLGLLYRREKPDIVHHFTSKCVLYGSLVARLLGIKRVINSITGMGFLFTKNGFFISILKHLVIRLYKIALKNSFVIFQNQRDMDFFIQKQLTSPDQCVLIAGSGVDSTLFRPDSEKKENALVVLPARMLWDKGISEFVEASRLLIASGIKARFALVGSPDIGNPNSIPEKQLKAWQESGVIEWWGWQENMVSVFQKATIVCLPSSYREGLSKSLIEAASCGCALVASDIPGCREVVEHGRNGLLVPTHDSPSLSEAIGSLLTNKNLINKMGLESRKIAKSNFSVEKVIQETVKIYDTSNVIHEEI